MPSPFADALLALIEAERNYDRVMHDDNASRYDVDEMEEQLAQAGDVLESELRKMMREEARTTTSETDAYLSGVIRKVGDQFSGSDWP